ncbi:MAG: RNA methyltransferase [Elusimicrobiota bacterium]|nr:RNA methyltransferase [Elusimicrobiota bacterium]
MKLRVVLVGPENPLNMGFVARAMEAFGADELVVAASSWTRAPEKARVTGAAAEGLLDAARFVPSLGDALRGCATALAFSRRPASTRRREWVLPDAPALSGRVALVFGRESSGLTAEEAALCPHLVRIPGREGLSLNLGQAAAVALYALTAERRAGPAAARAAAGMDRHLDLWAFLEPKLAAAPRFTARRLRRIRQLLYRLDLDDEELDLLFGVMNELSRPAAERAAARRDAA